MFIYPSLVLLAGHALNGVTCARVRSGHIAHNRGAAAGNRLPLELARKAMLSHSRPSNLTGFNAPYDVAEPAFKRSAGRPASAMTSHPPMSLTQAWIVASISNSGVAALWQKSFHPDTMQILLIAPLVCVVCCCLSSCLCGRSTASRQRIFEPHKKAPWKNTSHEYFPSQSDSSDENDAAAPERAASMESSRTKWHETHSYHSHHDDHKKHSIKGAPQKVWGEVKNAVKSTTAAGREATGREAHGKYKFGDLSKGLIAKVKDAIPP